MAAIEFLITANYKEVDAAIKKIEELKATLKGIKANDPAAQELIDQIKRQQEEYDKLVENIRQLKEEQAKQVQDAINENKKQEQEIERLAKAYKDLYEQMNKEASKPKNTESVIPPSAAQAQAGAEVKDQADAYQDLNKYITEVNGSLNNNIVRLLSEKQALATVKKELSELSKEEKASGKVTEENRKRKIELTQAEFEYKQSISQLEKTIKTDIKLNQAAEGSMSRLSLSLQRMKSLLRNEGSLDKTFVSALEKEIKLADSRLKEFEKSMGEYNRNVGNYPDLFKELSSSLSGISEATSLLPGPLGRATSSMHGLTAASLRFLATPLGAALAAIAAALATVASWFKRTQEGEEALNITSAYFKQTLESILDVVDNVGEWLYKAFTKPKDAAKDLVDFLEGQVMNRLNALGVMGESVMKIFSGDFSGGLKGIADAVAQAVTGIEKPINEASKFADDVIEKANKRAALADRENKLTREQTKWLVERSELEARINELRERSQDGSLSENERLKASQKASQLINQLYQKEISLAEEKRDIISETNKLSHSNTEALQKEAQAQADVNKAVAERYAKNRELLSQQKELTNKIGAYATESAKRIKEIAENEKKIEEKEREAELAIEEAKINAMQEGYEKQEALIQLNYKKRILSVSKMGEELLKIQQENERKMWESENPDASRRGLIFTPKTQSVSQLPVGMLKILADTMNAINIETEKEEADILKKTLDKYKDFATQRLDIEKKLNSDIKYLNSKRTSENSQQIDAAIAEAKKQAEKQLSNISFAEFKDTDLWQKMFGNLDKMAVSTLQDILERAKAVNKEGFSPEQMKEYQDALERLEDAVRNRNPFKSIQNDWNKLMKALKDGSKEDITSALAGIDSSVQKINSDLNTLAGGISNIFGDEAGYAATQIAELTSAIGNFATGAARLVSGDILGGVTSVVSGIGSIFSMGKKVKEMNAAARAEQQNFYDEAAKGEQEYQALLRERARLEQQLGETSISYNSRITAELDKQKKAIDRQVESLMEQLQQEDYISGVGYKHGTWFRKAKTWNEYESLMGKTYEEIEALYMSNKLDGKAKEIFEELQKLKEEGADIDKMLVEQAEAFKEYLSGMTFDSLKDSIKNAFDDGKFDIQDAADFTKQVFKKAILQALEAEVLEKALTPFLNSFQADAEAGTLFDPGKMDYYQEWIKRIGEEGNAFMDNLMKLPEISNIFTDASKRSASAKGIESISQDSANIIEGKLTAGLIYMDKTSIAVTDIASQMKIISKQSYEGWKNVETILDVVESIERLNTRVTDNTDDIKSIVSGIKENTRRISNDTDNINRNGVDIRR